MANTRAALNLPPSMTNLSVFTTLRKQLILTWKPLARGKLSMCEWCDDYVLINSNILTITAIMLITSLYLFVQHAAWIEYCRLYIVKTEHHFCHFIKMKEKNLFLFLSVWSDKSHWSQIQITLKALVMPESCLKNSPPNHGSSRKWKPELRMPFCCIYLMRLL